MKIRRCAESTHTARWFPMACVGICRWVSMVPDGMSREFPIALDGPRLELDGCRPSPAHTAGLVPMVADGPPHKSLGSSRWFSSATRTHVWACPDGHRGSPAQIPRLVPMAPDGCRVSPAGMARLFPMVTEGLPHKSLGLYRWHPMVAERPPHAWLGSSRWSPRVPRTNPSDCADGTRWLPSVPLGHQPGRADGHQGSPARVARLVRMAPDGCRAESSGKGRHVSVVADCPPHACVGSCPVWPILGKFSPRGVPARAWDPADGPGGARSDGCRDDI